MVQTAGVVMVTIITNDVSFELPFSAFIAWLSFAFHCYAMPFKARKNDCVQLLTLIAVAITLTSLQTSRASEANMSGEISFASLILARSAATPLSSAVAWWRACPPRQALRTMPSVTSLSLSSCACSWPSQSPLSR